MTLVEYRPRYKNIIFLMIFALLCFGVVRGSKSILEYSNFKRNLMFKKTYAKDEKSEVSK